MDTEGFEVDEFILDDFFWGTTEPASGGTTDSEGFELEEPEMEFGATEVATGTVTDSLGFELQEPEMEFGQSGLATFTYTDSPGFELPFGLLLGLPGDDAIEIGFDENFIPSFPGNRAMTEILYPVIPANELNKVLTRMDNKEWRAASKTAAPVVRRRSAPLRFRVDTSYMATFESDLQGQRGQEFRLQTPGYRPFGIDSEDNMVRILTYSQPQREDSGLTYLVDVYFRFIAVFA